MADQLTFDLPSQAAFGADDFFVAPSNALAIKAINGWQDWPNARMLLLGPEGAGKTHLLQVWQALTGATICDLANPTLPAGPMAIDGLEPIGGIANQEEALFHLINGASAARTPLLLTARSAPGSLGIKLPDLLSRLNATQTIWLDPPDDALLAATLLKRFNDLQLRVRPNLIAYLVPRIERSFAAVSRIVAALDAESLATGRPVSRALAGQILARKL